MGGIDLSPRHSPNRSEKKSIHEEEEKEAMLRHR